MLVCQFLSVLRLKNALSGPVGGSVGRLLDGDTCPLPSELDGNDHDERLSARPGMWLLPPQELEMLRSRRLVGGVMLLQPPSGSSNVKLYFALLHLHPVDLTLTFKYMALEQNKVGRKPHPA